MGVVSIEDITIYYTVEVPTRQRCLYHGTYTCTMARRQGEEGEGEGRERRGSPVPVVPARGATCPPRCTIYWSAVVTISSLRDALLVHLPTGESAAEEGGGVASG